MGKTKITVPPLDVFTCGLDGISNIEASAGTGKTWAICGLYLRLIAESGLKVNEVLVVTFTNAATAELRNRVRDRLVEVLHAMDRGGSDSPDPFVGNFLKRIDTVEGGREKLRDRLKTALFSFEEAAIFTIHSFCQRTLGDVPFASVQPFRVDVEQSDDDAIREVAADFWRRIAEKYPADDVKALIDREISADWFARELKRVIGKPTACLLFPEPPPDSDQAAWLACGLRRIMLRLGTHAVRAVKRRRRVISYNDMLYNLYAALTEGRFPGLAEELLARYPAALIDEFQDTDPLQFGIFRSIYGNGGSLFLVGDPKQAIYSFRSADLNTYLAAKRQATRQWTLDENQRSEEGLISAVNAFFEANDNVFCSPQIQYQKVKRGTKPLRRLTGDPEIRPALSVWLYPPGEESAMHLPVADRMALDAMAEEMSRLIAGGRDGLIKIGEDPLEPKNIAVLVRTKRQGWSVKAALARVGIGSVDLTDRSVFATLEAEEMERVLQAIAEPANAGIVRAALSTVLMGRTSRELDALNAQEDEFNKTIEQMDAYQVIWRKRGFGAMWRQLMTEQNVVGRLLEQPGGERRITNIMHLMELAAAAEDKHRGMESLLRWLEEKRAANEEEDTAQLRLESDENLVQIVTKHRAKGLEWPIVFCPFVWREYGSGTYGSIYTYHEGDDLVIDYTALEVSGEAPKKGKKKKEHPAKEKQIKERMEERVRLLYVALTRAVNRCYIAAGPFRQRHGKTLRDTAARSSIMNWIVAGSGDSPGAWSGSDQAGIDAVHQKWRDLFKKEKDIGVIPWASGSTGSLPVSAGVTEYRAREVARLPGMPWRMSSFTALTRPAEGMEDLHEAEAHDHDFTPGISGEAEQQNRQTRGLKAPSSDIIDFPAGAAAGRCIHAVFERVDFRNESGWDEAIKEVLASWPPDDTGVTDIEHAGMLRGMLANVVKTPLPGGFALRDVEDRKRFREIEFTFPVAYLNHGGLTSLLESYYRRVPKLSFSDLEGFLKGFIDLVFEINGKWFVLDWKSNKLGESEAEYGSEPVNDAMDSHAYKLQGLIYLTALHRYLKLRVPDYSYGTHMGGMLYLFVRGVRLEWPSAGIWHDLPDQAMIESLDKLFSTRHKKEGGRVR